MGATDSLTELYSDIRTHLLTYTDGGAAPNTIAAATSSRVFNEAPPDVVPPGLQAVPFVLLTIDPNPANRDKDPARVEFQVEVQVFNKPRTTIAATRRIADLAWKALANYQRSGATHGFVKLRPPMLPETFPPGGGEADREVVQIRVVAEGFGYFKSLAPAIP